MVNSYLQCLVINTSIGGVIAPEVRLGEEESCEKYLGQAGDGDQEDNQTFLPLPHSNLSDHLGSKTTHTGLSLTILTNLPLLFGLQVPQHHHFQPSVEIPHLLAPYYLAPSFRLFVMN